MTISLSHRQPLQSHPQPARLYPSYLPFSHLEFSTKHSLRRPHSSFDPSGLVDAHVHLNEPGRTEWEGFSTGTKAAASGGVTTVIDMPLNAIPPTTTLNGLEEKIKAAQGQCWVDVGFYGGIIPGNAEELLPLVEAGVRGFKGFLIESGVDEFPAVSSDDIALVLKTLKDSSTTLMFHAEMIPPITASVGDDVQISLPPLQPSGPLTAYDTFLSSRPPSFETYAVDQILSLAHLAPSLHLHIVHLSAIEAIPLLRAARSSGINITAETCFHYLALASEDVAEGDTRHKCCPPIRSSANRDGLWSELSHPESVIKTIVSDHSPCTPELKLLPEHLSHGCGAMRDDAKGVNGGLLKDQEAKEKEATSRSQASSSSSIDILDIVRLCAVNTAKQVGLQHRKGALRPGFDADICVFEDNHEWLVGREELLFRNKVSPYTGKTMKGRVKETWVRGTKVYERGSER
ncbi:allantoinase [Botrytis cinerea]